MANVTNIDLSQADSWLREILLSIKPESNADLLKAILEAVSNHHDPVDLSPIVAGLVSLQAALPDAPVDGTDEIVAAVMSLRSALSVHVDVPPVDLQGVVDAVRSLQIQAPDVVVESPRIDLSPLTELLRSVKMSIDTLAAKEIPIIEPQPLIKGFKMPQGDGDFIELVY